LCGFPPSESGIIRYILQIYTTPIEDVVKDFFEILKKGYSGSVIGIGASAELTTKPSQYPEIIYVSRCQGRPGIPFFGLQDGEFVEPPHFHPPSQGRGDVGYYFLLDI